MTFDNITEARKQALKNFSDFGELVWAINKTKAGKEFFAILEKRFFNISTWHPDASQFNIYYHEGQRSVIRDIKNSMLDFQNRKNVGK